MRIGLSLFFLFFLVHKLVRCDIVKRQISIPSTLTCINTKDDEYSIAKTFYKQFNQNNKFIDTSFNTTVYLSTSWSPYRANEPWKIDPASGLLVPTEIISTFNSSIFVTKIKNDLSYTFQVYFIGYAGVPSSFSRLKPGSTFSVSKSVYYGNTWFLKNLNISQVLVFRCGESPFDTSNVTYLVSQIKKTNYDYIRKAYMFYVDNTPNSGSVFVPDGVVSSTNGNSFTFTLNNDLTDSYSAYLIDGSGNAIFDNNIDAGTTFTLYSSFGFIWFLKNNNPNIQETLYIKLGEAPFTTTGVVINLSDILSTVEDIVPVKKILPYLFRQGNIGDCYLLHSIISILARYPQQLTARFLYPSQFRKTGAVLLKLWSTTKNCWTPFVLDDYFPRSGASFYGVSSSYFNEFWINFLEKAFAKKYGGYPNISTSYTSPTERTVYQALLGPMNYTSLTYNYDDPAMFTTIFSLYKSGAVVAFASRKCNVSGSYTGLYCYHGYGLLDLQENVAGTNFTLLKLQNPYGIGGGGESNLTWSDTSSSWDQYTDVKAALKPVNQNDGVFWLEKSDLSKVFEAFYAAKF